MNIFKFLPLISFLFLCACVTNSEQDRINYTLNSSDGHISEIQTLIIPVSDASYHTIKKQASITMRSAFQKSRTIKSYNGSKIIVTYKNFNQNLDRCPNIDTSLKNIQREIDFVENSVTLNVSNVTQALADTIEKAQCFSIDANTVKKVSDLYFETPD